MLSKKFFLAFLYACVNAEENEKHDIQRDPKLSIFQVVKFANSECTGSTRNGTCFTKAECESLGGSSQNSCADGFGVCCVVVLTTGQTSSVNNTYLTMESDVTVGAGYRYTICPCSDDICRMKFDFIDFTLEGPLSGIGTRTGGPPNPDTAPEVNLQQIGTCTKDSFQIVSPSGRSSPLICGENANQHMILDGCNDECQTVNLGLGASSSTTRKLNIRVTQYRCGEESGGPPGCLQYYENTTGKIRSFNFPDASPGNTITYNYATHLVNQSYKICIRRGNGSEVICYIPCTEIEGTDENIAGDPVESQPSFGLGSSANDAASQSEIDTACSNDYLFIPLGQVSTQFSTANSKQDAQPELAGPLPVRFCGNYFGTSADARQAGVSVCSYMVPFEVGVVTDDQEFCTNDAGPNTCESSVTINSEGGGGGILGFSLCYVQHVPPIA